MKSLIFLTLQSLRYRRTTALLTILAIAASVALVLSVQKIRLAARESFDNTVSGIDLIVGARSSPVNLLLSSVFRIGDATADVSWASYQKIARHRDVAWTIPFLLGDSYRGFRVLGTNVDYLVHYRYGAQQTLALTTGKPFSNLYDAVLGADVAQDLRQHVGDAIILAHGMSDVSFTKHTDRPFRVVGILAKTGTPVDRTVHVRLEAITAIHRGWLGVRARADADSQKTVPADLTPPGISAFLVGMRSKAMTFTMQRAINEYQPEALLAIIPAAALGELWRLIGFADAALLVVAACAVLAGLLGMMTAILTSLNERRREMAVLRSVGARPMDVFRLLMSEAVLLACVGAITGLLLSELLFLVSRSVLEHRLGIFVPITLPSRAELFGLTGILGVAFLMAAVPAWRGYRNALNDGLQPRL